jgi:hypothetical protein
MSISRLKTSLTAFATALAQFWEGYLQTPTAC